MSTRLLRYVALALMEAAQPSTQTHYEASLHHPDRPTSRGL